MLSPLGQLNMTSVIMATALLLALLIDHFLGEPASRFHPVVWIGNYLGWAGRGLQRVARQTEPFTLLAGVGCQKDFKVFWLSALFWCVGAAIIFIASAGLQIYLLALPEQLGPWAGGALAALLLGALLKTLLAWAMLKSEVLAVEKALDPEQGGSLAAGRERLNWLVSRDVAQLTPAEVRESAIETLAENLNDSVVAPIFWFVLLGLPGAALYRFANTADAMWGYRGMYKGRNWEWAGKWAAWADDVLSWIPARLTAYLLVFVFFLQALARVNPRTETATNAGQNAKALPCFLARLQAEAHRTASPNSGWPMAAMALALGVCLHKPGVYVLNAIGRAPLASDTQCATAYGSKVVLATVLSAQIAIYFAALVERL